LEKGEKWGESPFTHCSAGFPSREKKGGKGEGISAGGEGEVDFVGLLRKEGGGDVGDCRPYSQNNLFDPLLHHTFSKRGGKEEIVVCPEGRKGRGRTRILSGEGKGPTPTSQGYEELHFQRDHQIEEKGERRSRNLLDKKKQGPSFPVSPCLVLKKRRREPFTGKKGKKGEVDPRLLGEKEEKTRPKKKGSHYTEAKGAGAHLNRKGKRLISRGKKESPFSFFRGERGHLFQVGVGKGSGFWWGGGEKVGSKERGGVGFPTT